MKKRCSFFFACLVTCFILFGKCYAVVYEETRVYSSYGNISCVSYGSGSLYPVDEAGERVKAEDVVTTAAAIEIKPVDGYKMYYVYVAAGDLKYKEDEADAVFDDVTDNLEKVSDVPVSVYNFPLPQGFVDEEHTIKAVFIPEGEPYWYEGTWSDCLNGEQTRDVLCKFRDDDSDESNDVSADGSLCPADTKPDDTQTCDDSSDSDSGGGGGCFLTTVFDK